MEQKSKQSSALFGILIAGIVCLLLVISVARTIRERRTLETKAGTNTATVSLLPANPILPPNAQVQVWLNAANPVAFSHLEITFNPADVRLTQEVALTTPAKLARTVVKTTMAQANSTGKIVLALGLEPASRSNPPTGSFQLATLTFTANTTTRKTSPLAFTTNALLVANPDSSRFTITAQNSTLNLNGAATGTPSRTPTPGSGSIPGDLDNNNRVDIFDYNLLVQNFGRTGSAGFITADIDRNGAVDIFDYNILVGNFGR